ncbi:hypothetical protein TCAL_15336 [Tigriopus californicus]|uniref:Uncharacterized protein n=1 Tax=Tigriopus californicus TaxID=6832 RepID=A0A553PKE2_TIGCA|nr:hypothetical protein TCAL_15336 [Tigriopus californicus]
MLATPCRHSTAHTTTHLLPASSSVRPRLSPRPRLTPPSSTATTSEVMPLPLTPLTPMLLSPMLPLPTSPAPMSLPIATITDLLSVKLRPKPSPRLTPPTFSVPSLPTVPTPPMLLPPMPLPPTPTLLPFPISTSPTATDTTTTITKR